MCRQTGERGLFIGHVILVGSVAAQVEIRVEGAYARFGKVAEALGEGHLAVVLAVVVGTVRFFAVGAVLALFDLEEVGVVFLLFPPVGVQALILVLAALRVRANEVVHLPVGAHLARVEESGGAPPEVLPVVRVDTDFAIVVVLAIRAPDRLEVEHIEIHINFVLFNQLD